MGGNVIFKVTRQYMKRNRRRTAITFVGIVFMVLLMTCVFAGRETVMNYLQRVASTDKGGWHLIAYDLTESEAEEIAAMKETEKTGLSVPLGTLDFPGTGDFPNKPFIDVRAYSSETFELFNVRIAEGRFPENENELLLSASAVRDGATVGIGDVIGGEFFDRTITGIDPESEGTFFPFEGIEVHYGETVKVPGDFMVYTESSSYSEGREYIGRKADFTVVGIMETPAFENYAGASYAALTLLGSSGDREGVNALIVLDFDNEDAVSAFEEKVRALTGRDTEFDTNEILLAFSAKSSDSTINLLTIFIGIFFTVLIIAASVILIYNVFNMSFAERAKYLGMLSSVGATRKQKRQSIYYECFSLLLPALFIGIFAGLGVISLAMRLLKPHLDNLISTKEFGGVRADIPVTLSVSPTALCLIVSMCVVTVLVSAFIPAVKISRIGPVESVRGSAEQNPKKRYRTKTGLMEKGNPELLLALSGTERAKHLTRGIVRSVAVFAVLTMVLLYGAQAIIRILDILASDEEGWFYVPDLYDYVVSVFDPEEESRRPVRSMLDRSGAVTDYSEVWEIFSGVRIPFDGVSDEFLDAYREIFLQYADNTEEDWNSLRGMLAESFSVNALAVDDKEFSFLAARAGADKYAADDPGAPAMLVYSGVLLTTDRYRLGGSLKGYRCVPVENVFRAVAGEEVVFDGNDRETEESRQVSVRMIGSVTQQDIGDRYKIMACTPLVFINRAAYEALASSFRIISDSYFFFRAEGEEGEEFVERMDDFCDKSLDSGGVIALLSGLDTTGNIKQVIASIIRILAYCFTALVSVVCLLNLYNTIRGRAAERARETAVLRSMGMTDRQLTGMYDCENYLLLGKGLAIAAFLCALLCAVLRYCLFVLFGRIELSIAWLLLFAFGIAAFICLASSLFTRMCSRSARNSEIVEEIRKETV